MTAPAWLNVGAIAGSGGATSRSPALPASRANGNILVAEVVSKNNATHSISGAGWAAVPGLSQTNDGSAFTVSYWWREVDGSEAAPTISWTGSAACAARIIQWTRDVETPCVPFGAIGSPANNSGGATQVPGVTSTRNNSLACYLHAHSVNSALAQPSGWTERFDNGNGASAVRFVGGDKSLATSGTSSGTFGRLNAGVPWVAVQFELLEPLTGATGNLNATEDADTVSSAATLALGGTASPSEASDTLAATGALKIAGAAALGDDNDVLVASGEGLVTIQGAAALNEGDDSSSAVGVVTIAGAAGLAEASDTVAAPATLLILGTAALVEAGDTASGASGLAIAGAAVLSEAGDTASGASGLAIAGAAVLSEGPDSLAATGLVAIAAATSVTEAADGLTATAIVPLRGALAVTEADDVLAGSASAVTRGTVNLVEEMDSAGAAGVLTISAIAAVNDDDDTMASGSRLRLVASSTIMEADDAATITIERPRRPGTVGRGGSAAWGHRQVQVPPSRAGSSPVGRPAHFQSSRASAVSPGRR